MEEVSEEWEEDIERCSVVSKDYKRGYKDGQDDARLEALISNKVIKEKICNFK